jgi:predicted RNA-binding protein associated with RNAse of E/G family
MNIVTVQKCAPDGTPVFAYLAELAERLPNAARLSAHWERAPLSLGYTTFDTGDQFTEWFYGDRWYNVLRIQGAADGALKGWYCNITTPAEIGVSVITYRDLYLDLWVHAEGTALVLDEDEFDAAALDSATRQQALGGLAALQVALKARRGPFSELSRC